MPERSPFTSARNTGTPLRAKPSARTCSEMVLPVPVAPAISPWRLAMRRLSARPVPAAGSRPISIVFDSAMLRSDHHRVFRQGAFGFLDRAGIGLVGAIGTDLLDLLE